MCIFECILKSVIYTFILLYFYTLYFAKALFVFVKTHISINVIMCVFMCSFYSMQFKGLINSRDLNVFKQLFLENDST